ncbi:alpha-tocopherol transfer protein-like [Clavelina lepadiformis]|uniref:CRAL-TRIO domain-containing protein n=1 Tax=Clavelina lepadiformis TaxID=159417 RepID=A0ABP0FI38_CLALP
MNTDLPHTLASSLLISTTYEISADMEGRYQCNLTSELMKIATSTLNEPADNNDRLRAIDRLRASYEAKAYGPLVRSDDLFLLRFLRARKFDRKRSLKLLRKYHVIREELPQVFSKIAKPWALNHVMESGMMYVASKKTTHRESVFIYRPQQRDREVKLFDVFAYGVVSAEKLLEDEEFQICGGILIDDLKHLQLGRVTELSLKCLKLLLQIWQDAMPVTITSMHICNQSKVMNLCYGLAKPFLKRRFTDKMYIHRNLGKLHIRVNPEVLPPCLGGSGLSLEDGNKLWLKKLNED